MDQKNDFHKLDSYVVTSQRSGTPVLRLGFQMQLYLRGGETREARHRAVDVLAGFAEAASGNITHWQKHMASRLTKIAGPDAFAALHAEVDRIDPEAEIHGPHVTDAQQPPRWQGAALMQPGRAAPVDLSMLHLAMPATIVRADPDDLIARLLDWCAQARPLHGTAGLAPIYEIGMQQSHPVETWPLLSRFSGLDYMNAFPLAARGVNQVQGVNWLTILGQPILDEIGGTEALAARLAQAWRALEPMARPDAPLPPEYALHPFAGGVLVRAGEWPQLGDRNIGGVPLTYRVVAQALRPWLFTAYPNKPTQLIKVPRPLDAHAETLAWITRFDQEG